MQHAPRLRHRCKCEKEVEKETKAQRVRVESFPSNIAALASLMTTMECRSSQDELKAALVAGHDVAESEGEALKAVFVHADVRGASFNRKQQAAAGLCPSVFPPHTPVYSGHYHKPHTVPGTSISYIGSPFQRAKHYFFMPFEIMGQMLCNCLQRHVCCRTCDIWRSGSVIARRVPVSRRMG
jgi:hypothetical protein